MQQDRREVSVRDAAKALGIRIATVYQLLWDGMLSAQKDERGEWRLDSESVERYGLRRAVRRTASRAAIQKESIDAESTAKKVEVVLSTSRGPHR